MIAFDADTDLQLYDPVFILVPSMIAACISHTVCLTSLTLVRACQLKRLRLLHCQAMLTALVSRI